MNLPGICTNVLPGADWPEARTALDQTLAGLRARLAEAPTGRAGLTADQPLSLDLWLGAPVAARLLGERAALAELLRLLERRGVEVTMLNGFPYGAFHGRRVKEAVYQPDWRDPARAAYTRDLFALLHRLAPPGRALSVSTLPGSHKGFIPPAEATTARAAIRAELRALAAWLDDHAAAWDRDLHLGLEPEPFGLFEDLPETLEFFEFLHAGCGAEESARLRRRLGLNYDSCHFALQFAEAGPTFDALRDAGIRLSKVHLSSALELDLSSGADPLALLASFDEPVYLHQVIARRHDGALDRWPDLAEALADPALREAETCRIHFHIPVHAEPAAPLRGTTPALLDTLAWLARHPGSCGHLALETYTFSVLPPALRPPSVVEMLAREFVFARCAMEALR